MQVALVAVTPNRDVDVLFVITDGDSVLDHQFSLKNAFPAFVNTLSSLPGGLPNLHIGVITPDLGTSSTEDPQPGPPLGNGTGACSGYGKAGALQTFGATLPDKFIIDVRNPDGSRTTNYSGSLADVFAQITSAGSSGCGFGQTLEAAKRALDGNPANAGFLRDGAGLAVVALMDEDDCSLAHSSLASPDTTLVGPPEHFRCTHYGVLCDQGGATPDEMNMPGPKTTCYSNDSELYLTGLPRYTTFFDALKPDPRTIVFGAIVGDPTPVSVEMRPPPGGGTAIPALAHSCAYQDASNSTEVADPAVRIAELASGFARNSVNTLCMQDLSGPEEASARQIRNLTGDPCLAQDIALPADCEVFDETLTIKVAVPACAASITSDCYSLVTDVTACPDGQHLKVAVTRTAPAAPDVDTSVRCMLP